MKERPSAEPLPRYSIYLRALRLSMAAGAAVDFVLAAVLLLLPGTMSRTLSVSLPEEPLYLWLIAILVAMLGAFYALAAYDPLAYSANIVVAIAGRTAAGLAMLIAVRGRSDLAGLLPLAGIDLSFAAVHAVFWFPTLGRKRH